MTGFALILSSLFFFMSCLAFIFPGWFDAPELSLAIQTLGVSHPTGHPFYMLLAKPFTWLPLASVAWRTSFFSSCCFGVSVIAALKTFHLYVEKKTVETCLFQVIFALFLFFHPLLSLQNTRTEIYALACLEVVSIFSLYVHFDERKDSRFLMTASLLFGFSMATHPMIGICAAACFVPKNKQELSQLPQTAILTLVGYLCAFYLPLRGTAPLFLNWGQPSTFRNLKHVLLAMDYQKFRVASLSTFESTVWLVKKLGPAYVCLSIAGIAASMRRLPKKVSITCLAVFIFNFGSGVVTGIYKQNPDSYGYLSPSLFLLSAFYCLGIYCVYRTIAHRYVAIFFVGFSACAQLYLHVAPSISAWSIHGGKIEYALSQSILSAPPSSVYYPESDHWIFPLWYRQAVEHQRPDMVIVAKGLINTRWYRSQVFSQNAGFSPTMEFSELETVKQKSFLAYFYNDRILWDQFIHRCHASVVYDSMKIQEGLCSQIALNVFQQLSLKKEYGAALKFAQDYLATGSAISPCTETSTITLPFEMKDRATPKFLPTDDDLKREYLLLKLGCGQQIRREDYEFLKGN